MRVIDSHTGGEPTRLVIEGGPDLGTGPLAERRARFAREFDSVRGFCVNEPRGHEAIVGGLLVEPHAPDCAAGVIFFNNVGTLGMCGHGTIGLAVTLHHLGRIGLGSHRIDTPVGVVTVRLTGPNSADIDNVESYRLAKAVPVEVPGLGMITGDIAWGGNWFFLTNDAPCPLVVDNIGDLTRAASRISRALIDQGIGGADGAMIDHIEIFGPPTAPGARSKSFVLCPGGAYDRSPCGTGTSAKLACLAADGKLGEGEVWVQESIIGSTFTGRYRAGGRGILPTIGGTAYVTADARLILQDGDPFSAGLFG